MPVDSPAAPPPVAAAPTPAPAPAAAPPPNMIDALPAPRDPPRPGSARDKMRRETSEKWGDPAEAKAPAKPVEPSKPSEPGKEEPAAAKPGEEPKHEVPPEVTPEQKKLNPWKLYRQEKEAREKLERQLSEGVKGSLPEKERAEFQEKLTKAEAKLKEYEDEIRFKSYEKSDEYKTKYEKPYEAAWDKHMRDLREVPVVGEDGQQRLAVAADVLELVNLPLAAARKLAGEKWGDFVNEAMTARKEIRDLFEAKSNALDEARKTGADREKQFQENAKKWRDDVQKHIKSTWEEANQMALNDPKNAQYFKPVEGDDTHNSILAKGFAQVDKAFTMDPMNPKLSPEDRAKAVRMHAAIRNRSAGFGVAKYLLSKLREKMAVMEKELSQYKKSEPATTGSTSKAGEAPTTSARSRMYQAQEKFAK